MRLFFILLFTPSLIVFTTLYNLFYTPEVKVIVKPPPILKPINTHEYVQPGKNYALISGGFDFLSGFRSIHSGLPFTLQKDLKPCSDYFDEDSLLTEALQCANSTVFMTSPLNKPRVPKCQVITTTSPDVRQTPEFNYINLDLFGQTLAFYDTQLKEIFIVETHDIKKVWKHELQHYFLALKEGGESGDHTHALWNKCEPARYTPSKEAIEAGRGKLRSLF